VARVAVIRQFQFQDKHRVRGAFYCLVEAEELGFADGLRTKGVELEDYDRATKKIKALIEGDEEFCERYLRHPDETDLSFLCEFFLWYDRVTLSDFVYRLCYGGGSSSCT
jgi:hypothetical protein